MCNIIHYCQYRIQTHEEKDQWEVTLYKCQFFFSYMLKGDHSVYFSVPCFITIKESRIAIDIVWTQLLNIYSQRFNKSVIVRGYWARIQQSTTIRSDIIQGLFIVSQVCITKWMQAITNIMMQIHFLEERPLHMFCQEQGHAYTSKTVSVWRSMCLSSVS